MTRDLSNLAKLPVMLEQLVKPEHFNLRHWYGVQRDDGYVDFATPDSFGTMECGSVACVCGWYQHLTGALKVGMWGPTYASIQGHFSINGEELGWLFSEGSYGDRGLPTNDPLVCAREIRRFIAAGGIPE